MLGQLSGHHTASSTQLSADTSFAHLLATIGRKSRVFAATAGQRLVWLGEVKGVA